MTDFFHTLITNISNISKFAFFNYYRTGNPLIDTIISSLFVSIFGYFINNLYDLKLTNFHINLFFNIKYLFYKKNTIYLEGKNCSTTCPYSSSFNISSNYSKRFKAFINHIIENIDNNSSIYQIKETHSNFQSSEQGVDKHKNLDIYMVFQNNHFKLAENIFVKSEFEQEESSNEKEKSHSKIDKITLQIYSYVYPLSYLKNYIDSIIVGHSSDDK